VAPPESGEIASFSEKQVPGLCYCGWASNGTMVPDFMQILHEFGDPIAAPFPFRHCRISTPTVQNAKPTWQAILYDSLFLFMRCDEKAPTFAVNGSTDRRGPTFPVFDI
jgi:hypothetical protein